MNLRLRGVLFYFSILPPLYCRECPFCCKRVANAIPLVSVAISLFSIILMIACPLVTYVIVIMRFYKSCYGDEGYLTQTLPVSGKQIYFSKLLVAFCWCLLSILLVFLLLFSLMSLLTGVAGGSDISLMHVFVEVFGKLPLATSTKVCSSL